MISKRNFFSITIMMFILLVLFQFTIILRDRYNVYDFNSSFTEKTTDGQNAWKQETETLSNLVDKKEDYVLFVGDMTGSMSASVKEWCIYTKRNLITYGLLESFPLDIALQPELIILENENYAYGENLTRLKDYVSQGNIVVIGSLQNPAKIQASKEMQEFLGIRSVVSTNVKLTGMKVFEGLFLGGEVIYQSKTQEEKVEKMDLAHSVAWYQTASGTKTYMVGLMEEEENVKNEELPALIWRNGALGGSVFAVCGDYMEDTTAIGLLNGMLAESCPYTIYPVVNAQNLSILNFPGFANENSEVLSELYSRPITAITQDIIWPALVSLTEQSQHKMTCFMQPQADYTDENEPNQTNFTFFLKQMNEQKAEVGISMRYKKANSLEEKIKADESFINASGSSYEYSAAYINETELEQVLSLQENTLLSQVSTFVCDTATEQPLLSYCTEDITLQRITNSENNYTYRDDLRMRSVQSGIAYTNVGLNMQDIFWPKYEKDNWKEVQEKFASNLLLYWKDFDYFTSTTISESNRRVRAFLNLDYSYDGDETETILRTTEKGTWFILRTHDAEIGEIVGGSYEKLEEDVYMIYANTNTVRIAFQYPSLHYHTTSN